MSTKNRYADEPPPGHWACGSISADGLPCTLLPQCHRNGLHAHWCPTCKVETSWPMFDQEKEDLKVEGYYI